MDSDWSQETGAFGEYIPPSPWFRPYVVRIQAPAQQPMMIPRLRELRDFMTHNDKISIAMAGYRAVLHHFWRRLSVRP